MANTHSDSALRAANRHVVENVLRVEQLQELIAEVEANGEDPAVFVSTLSLFKEKLAEWRSAREELERALTAPAPEPAELACELR